MPESEFSASVSAPGCEDKKGAPASDPRANRFPRHELAKLPLQWVSRPLDRRDRHPAQGWILKEGISALVCCRDEEYALPFCLESLLHFVDQIICVDNGSSDATPHIMERFRADHPDRDIVVLDARGLLLPEARNRALGHVRRKWLLNCGGDFVFHTDGDLDARRLVRPLADGSTYAAYRFGHCNLYGDLRHTTRLYEVYALGEFYLVRFGPGVRFVEDGRFDFLRYPRTYLRGEVPEPVFMHLNALKADERLLYRNCYFDWRQQLGDGSLPAEERSDFDSFRRRWEFERFGSADPGSVRFRFQRQMALAHYTRFDTDRYGPYPTILRRALDLSGPRFEVVYRDGSAYGRLDREDPLMNGFSPSQEDLAWDPAAYLATVLGPDDLDRLGIAPAILPRSVDV